MAFLLPDDSGNVTDKVGGSTYGPSSGDLTIDNPNSDLQSWVDYQTAMNELAVNTAKQQWEAQAKADQIMMQFTHDESELAWQRQMEASNTAVSRYVEQLRKEGLNPLIALSNGAMASTPSSSGGSGVSSARQAAQLNTENVAKAFGSLVAELTQSAINSAQSLEGTKYAANKKSFDNAVSSIANLLGNLVPF